MRWSPNEPGGLIDGRGDGSTLKYYSTAQAGVVGLRCWKGRSRKHFEAYAYTGSIEEPFATVHSTTACGAKILIAKEVRRLLTEVHDKL